MCLRQRSSCTLFAGRAAQFRRAFLRLALPKCPSVTQPAKTRTNEVRQLYPATAGSRVSPRQIRGTEDAFPMRRELVLDDSLRNLDRSRP